MTELEMPEYPQVAQVEGSQLVDDAAKAEEMAYAAAGAQEIAVAEDHEAKKFAEAIGGSIFTHLTSEDLKESQRQHQISATFARKLADSQADGAATNYDLVHKK